MKTIETEIVINASPSAVWSTLINFEGYPEWNPFIKSISGNQAVGEQLTVFIEPPGAKGMTFKPKVLKFDPNTELRWLGAASLKGIFDGEHFFQLQELSPSQTRFVHGEHFSGLLVLFMGGIIKKK